MQLRKEDIQVYGDGSQVRSFCYVDDLVDGRMRLMATPDEVTGPMKLGNPVEFTIGQLAELVVAQRVLIQNHLSAAPAMMIPSSAVPTLASRSSTSAGTPGRVAAIAYFEQLLRQQGLQPLSVQAAVLKSVLASTPFGLAT